MTYTATTSGDTRRHIRGSGLLLFGHVLQRAINFIGQVLIIRYLSQTDYGAFAYALTIVAFGTVIVSLGLGKTAGRFIPIFHEQGDYNRLFGTIFIVASGVIILGLCLILLVRGLQGLINPFVSDQQIVTLLLILVVLAPVQAITNVLVRIFAAFATPRAIFFRYILGPSLKLSVVLLLVLGGNDVAFVASGFVYVGTITIVVYAGILLRILRRQGLLEHLNPRDVRLPVREILRFAPTLFTTDLMHAVMPVLAVVVVEYFHGVGEIALLRAVQPVAQVNLMVFSSLAVLFMPLVARMMVRHDLEGINNLYWRSASWMAIMSFPIFLLSFSLATPLTELLFGPRYEGSAVILGLLSFGFYFGVAIGPNREALEAFGRVRYILVVEIIMLVAYLGLNLLLIPNYGALGAAIATCVSMVGLNILKQLGLRLGASISLCPLPLLKLYIMIFLISVSLLLFQQLTSSSIYLGLLLVAAAFLIVLRLNRELLHVQQTFPELLRIPMVGWVLGERRA